MLDETPYSAIDSAIEEDARALTRTASALYGARETGDRDSLNIALDMNLCLWADIRTQTSRPDAAFPPEFRDTLTQLSAVIAYQCGTNRDALEIEDIDAMINTNLQIAEDLMDGRVQGACVAA